MEITKGQILSGFSKNNYWCRIYFYSDDERKTTVFASASEEYLEDNFENQYSKDEYLEKWHEFVSNKWEKYGEKIFEKSVHYDVYSNTTIGRENGLEFLKNEITP